jgi:hypothetical protein
MDGPQQLGAMRLPVQGRPINVAMIQEGGGLVLLLIADEGESLSTLCEVRMAPEQLTLALDAVAEFKAILDKTPQFAERLSQLLPVLPQSS